MAENEGTGAPGTGEQGQQAGGEPDYKAEAEKWQALARKNESRAKENASAAAKLAELEQSKLSETEKLTRRAETAEQALPGLQSENARLRVALEKSLPANLVDRLRGNTPEELAADADELLKLVTPQQAGSPSFHGGARTAPKTADMNSVIRQLAGFE